MSAHTVPTGLRKSHLGLLQHHCEDLNAESSLREIKSHCFLVVTVPLEGPDRRWQGYQTPWSGVHIIFHPYYLSSVLSFHGL